MGRKKTGSMFKCLTCGKDIYRALGDQRKAPLGRFYCSKMCRRVEGNEKQRARGNAYNYYRRHKELKKDICESCGKMPAENAHHHDYSKPHDVKWLCRPCHDAEHYATRVALVESRRKHFDPCACGAKAVVKYMCKTCYHKQRKLDEICVYPGCDRTQHARGVCSKHKQARDFLAYALPPKKPGPRPHVS